MSLSCFTQLLTKYGGSSRTYRCHLKQKRMKGTFRQKVSLQMLGRKRQTPAQSSDTNNITSRQDLSNLYATRYIPSCTTKRRTKHSVYHHVVPVPAATTHYVDRACQTGLRQASQLPTEVTVFGRALDECDIPNEKPPPPCTAPYYLKW